MQNLLVCHTIAALPDETEPLFSGPYLSLGRIVNKPLTICFSTFTFINIISWHK